MSWQQLVEQMEPLFGRTYLKGDKSYILDGLVHASDDYYYSMWDKEDKSFTQWSCVGTLAAYGFKLAYTFEGEG